jgi:membrane protein DedA with SNARE-associated domain
MIKNHIKKIPLLPISALIFYLVVLILWNLRLIPSPSEIIIFLETLYQNYGLIGVAIAAFLEGIVYLGLYFPGSLIIALAIFLSDGTLNSITIITLIVSITWTITSAIDYLLGRMASKRDISLIEKKEISKGFILSFIHQNILSFYFFNEGIERKNPWKLLIVFPMMFIWGFFVVSIFSLFRTPLKQVAETPYAMIALILIWFIIAFIFEYRRKNQ